MSTSTSRSAEQRLDRLESEREIHALVHRYAELCDAAYDPDGLAALFTEDATWSSRTRDGSVDFGRYEGREAIRKFFAGASKDLGPMTLHYLLAPRVELAEDGASATGVCYLLAVLDQRCKTWIERHEVSPSRLRRQPASGERHENGNGEKDRRIASGSCSAACTRTGSGASTGAG